VSAVLGLAELHGLLQMAWLMAWYHFSEFGAPPVFSPKVTPDPNDAKRLAEKCAAAAASAAERPAIRTKSLLVLPKLPPAEPAKIVPLRPRT
jgi:hypothetical protein